MSVRLKLRVIEGRWLGRIGLPEHEFAEKRDVWTHGVGQPRYVQPLFHRRCAPIRLRGIPVASEAGSPDSAR